MSIPPRSSPGPNDWEPVGVNNRTYRLKIEGGWLYRYTNYAVSVLVFVPDTVE